MSLNLWKEPWYRYAGLQEGFSVGALRIVSGGNNGADFRSAPLLSLSFTVLPIRFHTLKNLRKKSMRRRHFNNVAIEVPQCTRVEAEKERKQVIPNSMRRLWNMGVGENS